MVAPSFVVVVLIAIQKQAGSGLKKEKETRVLLGHDTKGENPQNKSGNKNPKP